MEGVLDLMPPWPLQSPRQSHALQLCATLATNPVSGACAHNRARCGRRPAGAHLEGSDISKAQFENLCDCVAGTVPCTATRPGVLCVSSSVWKRPSNSRPLCACRRQPVSRAVCQQGHGAASLIAEPLAACIAAMVVVGQLGKRGKHSQDTHSSAEYRETGRCLPSHAGGACIKLRSTPGVATGSSPPRQRRRPQPGRPG